MNERYDLTPAALYARVSSDRQDVDLSVAAQLRALRDYAEKNGYVVAREYIDEAESGRIADRPSSADVGRGQPVRLSLPGNPGLEVLAIHPQAGARRGLQVHAPQRGIRVTSITEHADDSPTGKLMEAIIEGLDEFYSENLAQEVLRGCGRRPRAVSGLAPTLPTATGRCRSRTEPRSAPSWSWIRPPTAWCAASSRWPFSGPAPWTSPRPLNRASPAPAGSLDQDHHPPHSHQRDLHRDPGMGNQGQGQRAAGAGGQRFPRHHLTRRFERVSAILGSKAPAKIHPRRAASPYLLSGIVRCETCGKALTAHEAKSGQFTYYVCHSLLKRGQGACDTPRLNSKRFERMIIDSIRENILTESNIRELVKLVNEELDRRNKGAAGEGGGH